MQIKGAQLPSGFNRVSITISFNRLWSFTPRVTLDTVYRWPVFKIQSSSELWAMCPWSSAFQRVSLLSKLFVYCNWAWPGDKQLSIYVSCNNKNLQQCLPALEHYSDLPSPRFGRVALILLAGFSVCGQIYLLNMWRPVGNSDSSSAVVTI